jgi:hypothetical protein
VAELDGDSIGVEGIDGVDEAVVDHVRNPKPGSGELVFQFPEVFLGFYPKGDVIEDEGAGNGSPMVLMGNGFDAGPFEKGDQIVL